MLIILDPFAFHSELDAYNEAFFVFVQPGAPWLGVREEPAVWRLVP